MRNKISAIIIDPDKEVHDYSKVSTLYDKEYSKIYGEKNFELNIITSTDNIYSELNKFKSFDCIITIDSNNILNYNNLNNLSFEFRKKWIHFNEFNPYILSKSIIEVFLYNINRKRDINSYLFSIFTCTFNTPRKEFDRLYNSLKNQTYHNWNWYILDDSTNPLVSEYIEKVHDPRIVVLKNITNHGIIGFNKNIIANICDGDFLVEVDHDDELVIDCLEELRNAYIKYPNSDFIYSDAMEIINDKEIYYGKPGEFAYGLGTYRIENVQGINRNIAETPEINAISIRGIHALPNHVRCWRKTFYHMIGGHNKELSILDDMDILIRTFLNGNITKIKKVLYIQYQGNTILNKRGETTQAKRFDEIQRTNELLRMKYDLEIHNKIINDYKVKDIPWIDSISKSNLLIQYNKEELINLNNLYIPENKNN